MFFRFFILLFAVFPVYGQELPNTGDWVSIIPPLLAVCLAFLTRKIFLSLGSAVLVGSFLVINADSDSFKYIASLEKFLSILFNNVTDPWNIKVVCFVLCILSMISLIVVSGGLSALVTKIVRWANNRQRSQLITFIAGLLVFIDDYANTMIVGSSLRPLTDEFKVSREKLSFIVDATSAPVAGLAIVSTWIGYEVGLFSDSAKTLGLEKDGYTIFFDALPFRFYCILMLIFVLITILRQREFGKMYHAEARAINLGLVAAENASPPSTKAYSLMTIDENSTPRLVTAILPFSALFFVLFAGLWIDGNGMQQLQHSIFNLLSPKAWYEVIQNTNNSSIILLSSAICGLIAAIISSHIYSKTPTKVITNALVSGLKTSLMPIGILLLAWSLKTVCNDLKTGEYMVHALSPYLSPMIFPALIFFIAAITAFGTGTSWGTMAILIPIAFPLAYALDNSNYGLITIICMAAVLDGAIFGDHCSPISDTTIMSSIASHCDHLHHVQTQLPYSLLAGALALFVGYLPAAMQTPPWISYLLGILILYWFLGYFGRSTKSVPGHNRNC